MPNIAYRVDEVRRNSVRKRENRPSRDEDKERTPFHMKVCLNDKSSIEPLTALIHSFSKLETAQKTHRHDDMEIRTKSATAALTTRLRQLLG